jgi:tetratricopeptide (TPR) repeat protein
MIVLQSAIAGNPSAARAHYYLGNLYYDKRRYQEVIHCWRRATDLDESFSIPWRNLGIAEFNILHDVNAADRMYARAFAADAADARLLYEWDQLKSRAALASPAERLRELEGHPELVAQRDDLSVEHIKLLNQTGQPEKALAKLADRRFSPWEGGEGLTSGQYVMAHRLLGLRAMQQGRPSEALEHFESARRYPWNLGEGKHLLTLERDLDFLSGVAAEQMHDAERARTFWLQAAAPLAEPGWQSYFQGLALRQLGDMGGADAVFSSMVRLAEEKQRSPAKIDYFATSLPNLLLFEDDLEERQRRECLFHLALASAGMGQIEGAIEQLEDLIAKDPNQQAAHFMLEWLREESNLRSPTITTGKQP